MNQDQWKGQFEVAIGAVIEMSGVVLNSVALKERGLRRRMLGNARARYGRAIASVIDRSR
jgi:hypothetical protein